MKNRLFIIVTLLAAMLCFASCDNTSLPRASKAEMEQFKAAGDKVFADVWGDPGNVLHSLMVLKDGKVVYEHWDVGYSPEQLHVMWSVSKTFTATAVGFAEQEGLLKTSDRVIDYFDADELPAEPHEWLKKMTLHDLLIMSSGWTDYIYDAMKGKVENWVRTQLASEYQFEPGTQYHYNSMNTYILSVIVSKVTGKKLVEYLNEKLFTPLGIDDYYWCESPQGYNTGGWGLYITTESFAKMGQFILQRGEWNGKQLLHAEWFDKATYPHIMQYQNRVTDAARLEELKSSRDQWVQGYSYQIWNCTDGAIRMHGANGQLGVIFPDKNAVVITTAYSTDTKKMLDSIWENIYPLL